MLNPHGVDPGRPSKAARQCLGSRIIQPLETQDRLDDLADRLQGQAAKLDASVTEDVAHSIKGGASMVSRHQQHPHHFMSGNSATVGSSREEFMARSSLRWKGPTKPHNKKPRFQKERGSKILRSGRCVYDARWTRPVLAGGHNHRGHGFDGGAQRCDGCQEAPCQDRCNVKGLKHRCLRLRLGLTQTMELDNRAFDNC